MKDYHCPVCNSIAYLFDVVDFNKSCEESNGIYLDKCGIPIYYAICTNCDFLFAPEFLHWEDKDFQDKIYNLEYIKIDPDYLEKRPENNFQLLSRYFDNVKSEINHIDYGGGNGLLSNKLSRNLWSSASFDPFSDLNNKLATLGKYDLITAFEVFEHVPEPHSIMSNINNIINDNGMIFFSTLINDGFITKNQRLDWWYASPRNGHISLFSSKSLKILGERHGFNFASMGIGCHIYYRKFPSWAKSLLG